jgi:hypothetical protein
MTSDNPYLHVTQTDRASYSLTILLVSLSLLSFTCTTAPEDKRLLITNTDASCTEAWIQVTGETGKEIVLTRDSKEVRRFMLTSSSMEIMDDTLEPKTTYAYTAIRADNGERSNGVDITTLDTTSHNFTWQTYTFGSNTSYLLDVAIISENDIWAVGAINITDTSVNGFTTYNAVHWDGNRWELKRIRYFGGCSLVEYPALRASWAFSKNDIAVTNGGSIGWFNGTEVTLDCEVNPLLTGAINKMWGTSANDLYVIGNDGSMTYHHGGQWQKLESGTNLPFQDIWGDNGEILAIASDKFGFGGQYLIGISGNSVKQMPTDITTASAFSSIWFKSNRKYFLAGNGVYAKHSLSDTQWEIDPISQPLETFFNSIRGSGLNNIATVGEGSYIAHFNGMSWKVYNELRNQPDRLSSVAVTENMIVAVGYKYVSGIEYYGVVYVGRR